MKQFIAAVILTAVGMTNGAYAEENVKQPEIEVVFVLDTTGSMSGLIEAAKQKIWSIAGTMAQATPTPKVKMGLVAYRDRGDDYVTKDFPITEDLDAMYAELMKFRAEGGGDGPESVNQALSDAVNKFNWKPGNGIYRTIFLVGDAPPHMDYQDDTKYQDSIKKATEKGIIVNTIQCGAQGDTTPVWQEIALKGEGKFFKVDQSGSAAPVSSPYDAEISKLSTELDGTKMYWGTREVKTKAHQRKEVGDSVDALAPLAAKAGRAAWNASPAGKNNFAGEQELVSDLAEKKVSISSIKTEELPDEMKGIPAEKREEYVATKQAKRDEIQKKIGELDQKRQTYLKEEAAKLGKDKGSLDEAVFSAVKSQAGKAGINITGGPKL